MKRNRRHSAAALVVLLAAASIGRGQQTSEEPALLVGERTKRLLTEALASREVSLRSRALKTLARIADPSTAAA